MPLTNAGRDFMASRMIQTSAAQLDNATARIGVGDNTTAFAVGQTDLQATTEKLRKGMDTSYPTIAANVITLQSTYGTTEANFAWNEWGVFNAASGGVMVNRMVEYNGTKLAGQTWVMKVTLTVNIGS
jgi:hypothetical protein